MDFYLREVRNVEDDPFGNDRVNKANVVVHTFPDVSQFWTVEPDAYLQLPAYEKLKGTWAR